MIERLEIDVVALCVAGAAALKSFVIDGAITRRDVRALLSEVSGLRGELSKLNTRLQEILEWRAGTDEFNETVKRDLASLQREILEVRRDCSLNTVAVARLQASHIAHHGKDPALG